MDITTLIGALIGIFLIIHGIGTDNIGNFIDISSILIVVGGTLSAVVASYPVEMLLDVPKHFQVLLRGNRHNVLQLVDQIEAMAVESRKNGLLALEDMAYEVKNTFLRQSVLMIVDAKDPDKVRYVLEYEVYSMKVRHDQVAGLYEKASAYAPAFGMIGTLIGLIDMLKQLDLEAAAGNATLGIGMSVALITTFYGSILSNLVFHPIAKKLRVRQNEEELYCNLVIDGVIAIYKGESPQYVKAQLQNMIKKSQQKKLRMKKEGNS